ncbi:MAG: hypothetical protein MK098_12950 [Marinovum sp.]|nr:hypothetical protein [Marinovum sp.]
MAFLTALWAEVDRKLDRVVMDVQSIKETSAARGEILKFYDRRLTLLENNR